MRQTLRVQDTVEALVVLVRRVNLDALQERGARECCEQAVGLDVRANAHGTQLRHVTESLEACRLKGSRQDDALKRGVGEGALSDRLQLRGMCVVVLEGHLGERLARESRVVDGAHARGDPHAGQVRITEGVRADLGHPLGDAHLCCATRVRHEHAVVDGEAIGIGTQR